MLRAPADIGMVCNLSGRIGLSGPDNVVDVAQLVELRIVTPAVEGSTPFVHPNLFFVLPAFFRIGSCPFLFPFGALAGDCVSSVVAFGRLGVIDRSLIAATER